MSNRCFGCSSDEACLSKLKEHLAEQYYAARTSEGYVIGSRLFLEFLAKNYIAVGAATPAHVEQYLKQAEWRYKAMPRPFTGLQRLVVFTYGWHPHAAAFGSGPLAAGGDAP